MSADQPEVSADADLDVDVVVVGAGFAGLYLVHHLRSLGFSVRGFEAGADVGGTWYWNRYPGARCDIESYYYCYSFDEQLARDWTWTEKYAGQPEILAYLNHVADRFELRDHFTFGTRVTGATLAASQDSWRVETSAGESVSARYVVLAVGLLSSANLPRIEGVDTFAGEVFHTGQWPHEPVDLTGKRVGVIGTGSSGIQTIPLVAQQASRLTVFQRTANFALPAFNGPADPAKERAVKTDHAATRRALRTSSYGIIIDPPTVAALEVDDHERERAYSANWQHGTLTGVLQTYTDIVRNEQANATAADFVRRRIAEAVDDPQVAEDLTPRGYAFGTKRPCLDTDYYATYNRDNVELVNLRRTPIDRITPTGVEVGGREVPLDALIFATGYDAYTGALLAIDVAGRNGHTLAQAWAEGPSTYLGLMVADFPNLFTMTGPGSPSALSNVVISIEQHTEWIGELLRHARAAGTPTVEAEAGAQSDWTEHVQQVAGYTLYPQTDSWYLGANIPGKPRVFLPYLGGVGNYRLRCEQVAAEGYPGFALT